MTEPDLHSNLKQALQSEIALLTAFNDVLCQESDQLLHNQDNDIITELSALKTQYVDKLAQANAYRAEVLNKSKLENTAKSLETVAQDNEELTTLVKKLFALAEQAKTQNESNGLLIHTYLQHNEQALNALAQLMQPIEKVYNSRGKASTQRSHNRSSITA